MFLASGISLVYGIIVMLLTILRVQGVRVAARVNALQARVLGALWMAIGLAFGAWKTRGFRTDLIDFDLAPRSNRSTTA